MGGPDDGGVMALPVLDEVNFGAAAAASLTIAHDVADVPNRYSLLFLINSRSDSFDFVTPVRDGQNFTKIGDTVRDGQASLSVWELLAPNVGNFDVVAEMEFLIAAQLRGVIVTHNGVDQTTPRGSRVSTTAALNIAATLGVDQKLIAALGIFDGDGPFSMSFTASGVDQDLLAQAVETFGTTGLAVSEQFGSGSVDSIYTYSHTAEGRSLIAIPLNGISAGGPGFRTYYPKG